MAKHQSRDESKVFEKEWAAVAASNHTTAAINCEKDEAACKGFNIASHPAIRLVSKGEAPHKFRGKRSAKEYVQ
jgi:hypothetical protein